MMRKFLLTTTVLTLPVAAFGQSLQSGNVGGMPYYLLPASGGCSAATPCSVVTYLSYMDEAQSATASDVQNYFGGAFAAANPHTIVIAPMITDPQSTSVNWGGYDGITSPQQAQMVAVVQAVEKTYGGTVNAKNSVVTGGSLGGDGTQAALIAYGPKGTVQPGIFSAGLSFDSATYAASGNNADTQALCGVPLMAVHGTNDTNQSISYDQSLAQSLSSCGGFTLVPVQGAGHGTWGGSSGYAAGDGSGTPLAWLSAQLAGGGSQSVMGPSTKAVTPSAASAAQGAASPPQAATIGASSAASSVPASSASPSTIMPGSGSITDASGNVWLISANGGIYENGRGVPGGGGTAALTIQNGTVYGLDAHGRGWLTLSSNGQYWTPSAAPSAAPPAVAASATAYPVAAAQAPTESSCTATSPNGGTQLAASLIPPGYLHTAGSQIVDAAGEPVRIAAAGSLTGGYGYSDTDMQKIVLAGFNAFRISYFNARLQSDLAGIDKVVASATKYGLKVIIDHHANEGNGNCNSQQANGLWYDVGGASDGTDGCGATGTVTQTKFLQDWLTVAQRYAGNSTVIGFDLDNEPQEYPGMSSWGDGNPNTDIRLMYQTVGNAILGVNPGVLIIAEGPQHYPEYPWGDLSKAASQPVTLSAPSKLVYSVHDYPAYVSGVSVDSGPTKIPMMNAAWGYLVAQGIAPVWVGEMGASLDGTQDSAREQAWAATLMDYLNGRAAGGPVFSGKQQGISTDWWWWGSGGLPNGTLDGDGNVKQGQWNVYSQLKQQPICGGSYAAPAALSTTATDVQNSIAVAMQAASQPAATATPLASAAPPKAAAPLPAAAVAGNVSAQQTVQDADAIVAAATASLSAKP